MKLIVATDSILIGNQLANGQQFQILLVWLFVLLISSVLQVQQWVEISWSWFNIVHESCWRALGLGIAHDALFLWSDLSTLVSLVSKMTTINPLWWKGRPLRSRKGPTKRKAAVSRQGNFGPYIYYVEALMESLCLPFLLTILVQYQSLTPRHTWPLGQHGCHERVKPLNNTPVASLDLWGSISTWLADRISLDQAYSGPNGVTFQLTLLNCSEFHVF